MTIEESNLNPLHRSDSNMKALCQYFLTHAIESLDTKLCRYVFDFLKAFGAGKIDDSLLISTLNRSFSGHDHLLQCFQSILPPPTTKNNQEDRDDDDDDHIVEKGSLKRKEFAAPDKQNPPKRPRFSEELSAQIRRATAYCNKVRDRFQHDDEAYKSFLDAMSTCYDKNDDDHKAAACEVVKELKSLFGDNTDLLVELCEFKADLLITDEEERKAWEARKRGISACKTSYRQKKEHPCPDMLHKIDDDNFECDLVFHSLQDTRIGLEEFVQAIKEGGRNLKLEDYLPAIYLRRIEVLYGMTGDEEGHGEVVIERLRANRIETGEIVLERLRQKEEEITEKRRKYMLQVWAPARKNCNEKLNRDYKLQYTRSLSPNSPFEVEKELHNKISNQNL